MTGGAGDLGSAIAEALLRSGALVAVGDLRPSRRPAGERFRSRELDLTDGAAVEDWVRDVATMWGAPTIAVLAAGTVRSGRLVDTDAASWQAVIDGCLTSAFLTSTAVIRAMRHANSGGRIVAIGSWAADAPHPHIGAYTTAKAGLRGLVRTLALDHARDGILVNEVAPGVVSAGMSGRLLASDPALLEQTLDCVPAGHLVGTRDVVRDVLYLVSPHNRSTTGATIVTDGGLGLASQMNPGARSGRSR
ncbi:SDR family NAD(P)-dependent oxidoreductase [Occultella kanbiaonis]|uniref:SDR family NAD(P)-dependent oxidoreductase n=1 Tax=Occultella kanbiaonis TaxID=2675754 RepID=UPI0013D2E05D|nr:SDR family oxidoreductase [Occultella kanbiaonis]